MSRKGALTGGYYDTRMSRLEQQRLVNEHTSRLAEMEREKAELKRQLEDILYLVPLRTNGMSVIVTWSGDCAIVCSNLSLTRANILMAR